MLDVPQASRSPGRPAIQYGVHEDQQYNTLTRRVAAERYNLTIEAKQAQLATQALVDEP
jgi:hypothetical protein